MILIHNESLMLVHVIHLSCHASDDHHMIEFKSGPSNVAQSWTLLEFWPEFRTHSYVKTLIFPLPVRTEILCLSWSVHFDSSVIWHRYRYSLFQKKHNFLKLPFIWRRVYASESGVILPRPSNKISKTLCPGQWPRGTRENGQIKVAFLLEMSVL